MIFYAFILVFAHGALTNAQDDASCRVNASANATLEQCLSSFVYKWDDIRKVKPQIDALVYPLWTLSMDEVRSLCLRVDEAEEKCGASAVERCQKNEVARFVQQNFMYACSSRSGSLFAESAECLLSTINSKQECLMLLKKPEDQTTDGCAQLGHFLQCVHDDVQKACKAKGVAALVHGIDKFGCDIGKMDIKFGAQDQALPNCLPPDWQAVTNCFQPLLNMWAEIRDNDTSLLETGFPVFKFDRTDMAKMCEMVHTIRDQCALQVQRCPSHQLPEFTNSILGLACGSQQAVFFLSYDCVRKTIMENTQCHAYIVGAWQPGHLKEVCARMPQFYKCLERPVAARCANDGVNVLAQSIRQFGCELNVEPLPHVTTLPTIAPTTIATVAASAPGVAGPPGSNGGFLLSQGNQHGLGASPAPFLNAPPPALVSGPQEPLFKLPVIAEQQQAPASSVTISVPIPQPAPPAPATPAPPAAPAAAPSQLPPAPPAPQQPQAQPQQQQQVQPQSLPAQPQAPVLTTQSPLQLQQTSQSTVHPQSQPQSQPLAQPQQPVSAQSPPQHQSQPQTPPQNQSQSQVQQPAQPQAKLLTPAEAAPAQIQQTASTTTTTSPTTTAAPTPLPGERKQVQPIPLVPHLLEICDIERRNQVRKCLHPLFKRWVQIHTRMLTETYRANLTFPLYHYAKNEVIELCDQYATAFLQCPFSVFQECLRDEVVFLANAILGYTCSPQNIHEFTRHFDCVSTVLRARNQCSDPINGPLLIGRDEATRCIGVKQFYECNKSSVKETCTSAAERVFKETVRQFGCELDSKQ